MTWPDSGLIWTMKSVYQTFAHTAAVDELELVQVLERLPVPGDRESPPGREGLRVAVRQDVRAVALDEARAVVGKAPALSLVPDLSKQAKRA